MVRESKTQERRPTAQLMSYRARQPVNVSIDLPLETRASCHFLSNFVLLAPKDTRNGFLEFIVPLISTEAPVSHFKFAFDACALASLSNKVGSSNAIELQALTNYTKALSLTSTALRNGGSDATGNTLAAVFLLGLFEHITARHIKAWRSHIEGAMHLMAAKPPKPLWADDTSSLRSAVQMQMVSCFLPALFSC